MVSWLWIRALFVAAATAVPHALAAKMDVMVSVIREIM